MTDYDSFEDASSALQVEYKKLNQLFSDAISRLDSGKEQAKQQMGLLRNVEAEFSQENPVTIALLGGTGHGKSTLANAILGQEVLPTSFSKVCTAGITRVRFRDIDGFSARVTFLSMEAVNEEIQNAKIMLQNEKNGDFEEETNGESRKKPRELLEEATKTRLESILGSSQFEDFLESYGLIEIKFPALIESALSRKLDLLTAETPAELKKQLSGYLVVPKKSNEGITEGAFWPIVQDVLIEGRFKEISHGAQIVDLPGLNDPNPAREKVTTDFLKEAKFVFIVFRFSRGVTEDIHRALKPRDLLKRLLLAGSSNSLTFIATHCDSIQVDADSEEAIQNPDLGIEELTKLIVEEHRRIDYPDQIAELARELIPGDSESEEIQRLRAWFSQSAIFMTSAQNYLNIAKLESGEKVFEKPRFSTKEMTGIPELCKHLSTLSLEAGPKMLVKRIQNLMIEPANRITSLLTAESNLIDLSNQAMRQEFDSLIKHISSSKSRTEEILQKYLSQQREYLQQVSKDFITSINVSPVNANKIKADFETYLFSINHWRTMKAAMQYGGSFYSSSRGFIDIKGQITQPIFDSAFLPWIRFFEGTLAENVDATKVFFVDQINDYIQSAESNFPQGDMFKLEKQALTSSLRAMVSNLESRIDAIKESLNLRISETRAALTEIVTVSVDEQMNPLIRSAAGESGSGMMTRIRGSLNGAAGSVIEKSFSVTREKIAQEIEVAIFGIDLIFQEVYELVKWEIENFSQQFNVEEIAPKPIIDEFLPQIKSEIVQLIKTTRAIRICTDWDKVTNFPEPEVGKKYLIIDGSNVSTKKVVGKGFTSIDVLLSCRSALIKQFPQMTIITLVDAAFIHKLEIPAHKARFRDLVSQQIVRQIPSYIDGGGDIYILTMADHYNAAVVSDDSFKPHLSRFPFVRESKRRLTFILIEGNQWFFSWAKE